MGPGRTGSEHQSGIAACPHRIRPLTTTTGGTTVHPAMLSLASLALAMSSAFAQTPLERGKYLVEGVLTCGNCHTPRGPGGVLDSAKRHAGGPQVWETAEYKVRPSNITPDKDTGIGG